MLTYSLPIPPPVLTVRLHRLRECSPTNTVLADVYSVASVTDLSPVKFSAQARTLAGDRPVSCYAFFKGWLLLSQPPGCLGEPTSFPT